MKNVTNNDFSVLLYVLHSFNVSFIIKLSKILYLFDFFLLYLVEIRYVHNWYFQDIEVVLDP